MCLGGEQVEFRATPEQSCGTDLCCVWTQGHFRAAENSFGSNQWFEADFGEFLMERQNCHMILFSIILGCNVIILGASAFILGAFVIILAVQFVIFC